MAYALRRLGRPQLQRLNRKCPIVYQFDVAPDIHTAGWPTRYSDRVFVEEEQGGLRF
jgi:hypothetical protein